jgi:outer membrane protein
MKNISLILNVVLLVAVAVLYFLHFSGGKSGAVSLSGSGTIPKDIKIAYIKSDTVLKYYDYFKVNRDQLEAKTKKMETEFRNRALGLQNEIASYQRNVGSMTLSQVRSTEEDLGKKQQNLQMYEQSLQQQLMEEQTKLIRDLYERITTFLKKYGAENELQVVLKFDANSDVLFGGEALDITQDVIKGLNDTYQTEKLGKADTTAAKK